jgi:hypothetical protein
LTEASGVYQSSFGSKESLVIPKTSSKKENCKKKGSKTQSIIPSNYLFKELADVMNIESNYAKMASINKVHRENITLGQDALRKALKKLREAG